MIKTPEIDLSQLTEDEKNRIDEINEIITMDELEPTIAMNILINAIQICYDNNVFNDLDKFLIAKSLNTFQNHVERGEDIILKAK